MNTIPRPRAPGTVEACAFPSGEVAVRVPGHTMPIMIPADIAQAIADAVSLRRPRALPLGIDLSGQIEAAPCRVES